MPMNLCRGLAVLTVILSMTACSSKYNYFSNHDKGMYTDNLLMDTNAITAYPYDVSLYSAKKQPKEPFDVIGQLSVSNYNQYGIKRQEAEISRLLRFEAAALGGNGVISLGNRGNVNYAEVIKFQDSPSSNS